MTTMNNPFATVITDDRTYEILPAGTYDFTIKSIEMKIYEGSPTSKIQAGCGEIDLQLSVDYNGKNITVFDRLYTDEKMRWKIAKAAKCVGIFHDGFQALEFARKEGCKGKAKIGIHEYNGKKSNQVNEYIEQTVTPEELPF